CGTADADPIPSTVATPLQVQRSCDGCRRRGPRSTRRYPLATAPGGRLSRYGGQYDSSGARQAHIILMVLMKSKELAERKGFEPSRQLLTVYSLSRGAPSTTRPPLRRRV